MYSCVTHSGMARSWVRTCAGPGGGPSPVVETNGIAPTSRQYANRLSVQGGSTFTGEPARDPCARTGKIRMMLLPASMALKDGRSVSFMVETNGIAPTSRQYANRLSVQGGS